MKKWETPKIEELGIKSTQEDTCYCANGEVEAVAGIEGRKHGGGHCHKPPHQGGHCPDKPVQKPECPTQS